MIQLDWKSSKRTFFDRKAVRDAIDRARHRALSQSAALVWKVSRRSMRYRRWRPDMKGAPPGSPPFARTGRGSRDALVRRALDFGFDTATRSAVVGPVRLGTGATGAPANLEFGGTVRSRGARKPRKVGDWGEVRVSAGSTGRDRKGRYTSLGGRSSKLVRSSSGQRVRVTYGRIRTSAQAARANRIADSLFRPVASGVRIAPRPFMAPALRTAAPYMPSHWRNSVRGT